MGSLTLKSPAFQHEGIIPVRHTCEGDDISPELSWQGGPKETKSYVLIVDDPDAPDPTAPKMTWVHWVMYDIPADVHNIPENIQATEKTGFGGTHGITDFKRLGYGGPCPPIGDHRYYFKLYAVDTLLNLPPKASKREVEERIKGHILDQAVLMGHYPKQIH